VDSGAADEAVEVDGDDSKLFPVLADIPERIHLLRNLLTHLNGCVDLQVRLEAKEKFYQMQNSHQCQSQLPENLYRIGGKAMTTTITCNDPCRCLSIILWHQQSLIDLTILGETKAHQEVPCKWNGRILNNFLPRRDSMKLYFEAMGNLQETKSRKISRAAPQAVRVYQ
jgi:hypothetical protein